jgi:hypothetical protein
MSKELKSILLTLVSLALTGVLAWLFMMFPKVVGLVIFILGSCVFTYSTYNLFLINQKK